MSKRPASTDVLATMSKKPNTTDDKEITVAPVKMISAEQIQALKDASSLLPQQLAPLLPLLQDILAAYEAQIPPHKQPIKTVAATDIEDIMDAAVRLKLDHRVRNKNYGLYLKDNPDETPALSPHYSSVISNLRDSDYNSLRLDESFSRTVIDLILLDRLNHLKDSQAYKRLLLSAEVPVSIKVTDDSGTTTLYRGRADWALGYGEKKSATGSVLIVVEAKRVNNASIGMPQLVVYMAAAHEARQERGNRTVWGMLSDGDQFFFACLNNQRKLLTSAPLTMRDNESAVLRHIDTILLDAIHSSPHTTPVKVGNTSLRRYNRHLAGSWSFGIEEDGEEDGSEDDDDKFVDVVKKDGVVTIRERSRFSTSLP